MPAEWEPHAATWIAWPHNRDDWPGKFSPVRWVYTEIVRHLSRVEQVHIVVAGASMKRRVADQLDAVGVDREHRAILQGCHRSELGARHRPNVRRQATIPRRMTTLLSVSSTGNSMAGPSTTNHNRDNRLPRRIAHWLMQHRWAPRIDASTTGRPRVVMEGGAIDVNGHGTLLTTEECLLSEIQARNPGLDRNGHRADLRRLLGC